MDSWSSCLSLPKGMALESSLSSLSLPLSLCMCVLVLQVCACVDIHVCDCIHTPWVCTDARAQSHVPVIQLDAQPGILSLSPWPAYTGAGILTLAIKFVWSVTHPLSYLPSPITLFLTRRQQQGPRETSEGGLAEGCHVYLKACQCQLFW